MARDNMKPQHEDPVEDIAIGVQGGFLVVRRRIRRARTIVMVHGLGESGLSFKEGWTGPFLTHYDVIVPDLMGYGRSSGASDNDYCLDKHNASGEWWITLVERFFLVRLDRGILALLARHDP
jgi:pimeloyl-ACP methyl ester carboxylesterase